LYKTTICFVLKENIAYNFLQVSLIFSDALLTLSRSAVAACRLIKDISRGQFIHRKKMKKNKVVLRNFQVVSAASEAAAMQWNA
jgi:hypothetical protein